MVAATSLIAAKRLNKKTFVITALHKMTLGEYQKQMTLGEYQKRHFLVLADHLPNKRFIYQSLNFFTANTAFKPPNANEFEIAAVIGMSRASFGT